MLVTLTGGAGAGKTTLAAALAAAAPQMSAQVLHGDDYYFPTPGQGVWAPDDTGELRLDVGDPRSQDLTRLSDDTDTALARVPVVIVDGLFARHVTPRTPCTRFDVFVDLPADLRLARKIQRKCLRDGFPLDVLLRNYLDHRRDAHDRHIEPLRDDCDMVVDGSLPADDLARRVWSAMADRDLVPGPRPPVPDDRCP
ncbi:uridine kinase [Streptomyces sp. NPDC052040]|uniref:uridine kinase n=1 Tax=Streptomyces sp. NPDC052040 TaxID=3365682 RepID=UPI0037D2537F